MVQNTEAYFVAHAQSTWLPVACNHQLPMLAALAYTSRALKPHINTVHGVQYIIKLPIHCNRVPTIPSCQKHLVYSINRLCGEQLLSKLQWNVFTSKTHSDNNVFIFIIAYNFRKILMVVNYTTLTETSLMCTQYNIFFYATT